MSLFFIRYSSRMAAVATTEDFLDVDKPVPGQNFVCLSFVSPEKILAKKEEYSFFKYIVNHMNGVSNTVTTQVKEMLDNAVDGSVDVSQIIRLKKALDSQTSVEKLTFDKFKEQYDDFIFRDNKAIQGEFDETNGFQTSVRGVKVRGVYDTYKEAEMRAKVLQRMDQSFNVFVGQVGYWLPWDPEAQQVENQEYLNDDLNRLVKEYKDNEVKKDIFYQEQTRERKREAMSVADRLRKKLDDKRKAEAAAAAASMPAASADDLATGLQAEDPWMKRKQEAAADKQ